jgi:hypothetical protein
MEQRHYRVIREYCLPRADDGWLLFPELPVGTVVEPRDTHERPTWAAAWGWMPVIVRDERCWVPQDVLEEVQ